MCSVGRIELSRYNTRFDPLLRVGLKRKWVGVKDNWTKFTVNLSSFRRQSVRIKKLNWAGQTQRECDSVCVCVCVCGCLSEAELWIGLDISRVTQPCPCSNARPVAIQPEPEPSAHSITRFRQTSDGMGQLYSLKGWANLAPVGGAAVGDS